ncbi:MAG TPA: sugar phosphate nucleotidyltransferase [Solirubrobacterales bacterium]|jgi:NDP-sugar pyrophosphorylase family protein
MSKKAVVLAGGKGSRLAPYTTVLPKPLLPVGDRAILDVVVRQLRDDGFTDLTFAVGYLAHLIRAVFSDGSGHDVSIAYHEEDTPLGTAGALATVEGLNETFLAMNGDVLTALDYGALYQTHRDSGNLLTIATHRRVVKTDYGVIHVNGSTGETNRVTGYEEKPEIPYTVSMGVYVAEPEILDFIPQGEHFDVPDLVVNLLEAGKPVGSYLYEGYWLDIGRHDDYERAIAEYEELKDQLFRTPDASTV